MPVDVIIDPSSGQIYWNDAAGSGTQTIAISGNATNAINIVGYSNFFSPGGGGLGTQILATFTDSATSTFTPGTNAYDLGSSSLRWNFYGTGGNFTGAISTSSTTASTSSTTGALIVTGGAGIAKTSYFGQDVFIQGATASTGFSTGALVVTGGVGIGGSLYTGTTTRSSISGVGFRNSRAENGFQINATSSFTFNITDEANNQRLNYHSDSNRTEFTGNNATHEIRLIHSNNSSYTGFKANSSGTVTYTLPAGDGSAGQVLYTNGSAGLAWTTPGTGSGGGSTGVQSGAQYELAYYTATGSSVAGSSTFKNDTAAAKVTITHTTASTSTTTGALVISGGVGIAGSIWSGQHIVTDTTTSSSTSTGAMLVFGGLGVSGQVNAASLQTSGNAVIAGNLQFNGAGTFGNATTDTINSLARYISDILPSTDNSYDLGNNSLGWRNFRVSGVGTIASLAVTSSTASTNTTTGALTVAGGVGIAKTSYFGQDVVIQGTTSSTGFSTGALTVAGGVGISGRLNLLSTSVYASFITDIAGIGTFLLNNQSSNSIASSRIDFRNNASNTAFIDFGSSNFYLGANQLSIYNNSGEIEFLATGRIYMSSSVASTSTTTGTLVVFGGVGVGGSINASGVSKFTSSAASTSSATGALIVTGGVGIGGSLWTSTSNLASVSGVTLNNGTITGTLSGTATSAQVLATTTDTSSTLYLLGSRSSTGFGGTALYVDSSISILGSQITAGVWGGTAISAVNGGTGQVSYTIGDILYASSTTALSKLAAGTAGSVLASGGVGAAPSWVLASSGGGAGTVASGTANQVAYYASTGASVSGAANLTYNTTSVIVANTTASNNNSSGALLVYGGIGASGQISGAGASFTSTVYLNGIQIGQGGNNINILDSSGATIANFNTSNGWFRSAQTTQSTSSATGSLVSLGGLGVAKAASIGETIYGYSTVASTGWSTGSLILSGGLGVSKTSYINGDLFVTSSTGSSIPTRGALVVTGSVGIGGTLSVGTAITAFDPVGVIAMFARNTPSGSAIVAIQNTSNNAFSMATLNFRDHLGAQAWIRFRNSVTIGDSVPNVLEITNQASQILYTAGSGSSSNHLFTGGSGVSIEQTNASTSSTTGALVVTGGVGVGGSLWTSTSNFSSVSGVGISNSVITSGVWSGTAISAVKGGTGQVSYAIGDILYASSTTALTRLGAGTAGSVLASGGAGAAPFWKVDATGAGGAPGGSNYQLQYNNSSAFGGASRLLFNSLLAEEFLITSPYQTSVNASLNIGLGTTSFDGTSLGRFTGSSNGTVFAINQISGFTGNFADFQLAGSSKFTIGFDGKITVVGVYSLPTTAGTAGSVLTSNGTGNQFYWSAPGAAGGGSGTVTSGTAGSVAFYTGSGTTVGGAPGFTYTTAGTASTVNIFGGGTAGTYLFTVQAYSATSVRVGIGTNLPQYELEIVGELSATNKSFVIDHPTKPGKKLRYGSLEGPENGVYVRGELKDSNIIETPDHWVGLVHPDSFTVTLTPIGRFSYLYVEKIEDYKVFIADAYMNPIHCYYTVWAERKDIPKLITEY